MSHVLFFFPLYMKCYVTTQCYLLLLILHHSRELKCTFNMTKKFIHGKNIYVKHQIKLRAKFSWNRWLFSTLCQRTFHKIMYNTKIVDLFLHVHPGKKKYTPVMYLKTKQVRWQHFHKQYKIIACNMYTSEHLNDSVLFTGTHIPI